MRAKGWQPLRLRPRSKDLREAPFEATESGVLRRMHAIVEGVADGVFVTDKHGVIRLWNGAAGRMVGSAAKRAIGVNCSRLLGLGVRERTLSRETRLLDCSSGCALLREFGDRATSTGVECVRRPHAATEQQLLVNVSAVEDDHGDIAEVVHSVRDITRLKEGDDAKTMFLATASHELKTPLTVILGYTQTLRAGLLDESQKETALHAIESRAQQLGRIVDRLLLTGRIESGRLTLELSTVCPAAIIPERAESLALATGRRIVCEVAEDTSVVVADEQALITVLDHLMDNAVKYSPDGGEIIVRAHDRGSTVVIEVIDNGIGMNADDAAQCFDRFWQVEQTDVRRYGGTGVGLYIVKSYVEAMGGRVAVRSDVGQGSAFSLTLRKATEATAQDEDDQDRGVGKHTMIHEFMRQLGVPGGGSS